jgi:IS1 family transposase
VISRLEAEANAMWSFVHKQAKKPWRWIAMDATGGSRVCIAVHKGKP